MNTVETEVRKFLVSNNIRPFSVLFMRDIRLLKISFYLQDEVEEFLDISGYTKMCDNFGYQEYPNTILIFGSYLNNFLRNVGCEEMY